MYVCSLCVVQRDFKVNCFILNHLTRKEINSNLTFIYKTVKLRKNDAKLVI